jgi:hypothetical protein
MIICYGLAKHGNLDNNVKAILRGLDGGISKKGKLNVIVK